MQHTRIISGQRIDLCADPEKSTSTQALNEAIEFCKEHKVKNMYLEYGEFTFGIDHDSDIDELIRDYRYWEKFKN